LLPNLYKDSRSLSKRRGNLLQIPVMAVLYKGITRVDSLVCSHRLQGGLWQIMMIRVMIVLLLSISFFFSEYDQ
jgi:hypothetical protein